jgi:hypothetical protein
MFAYTTDTNTLWLYTGSTDGWVNVLGSDIGQQALSNRNVIINGAMQVAQRGTSVASITSNSYNTADRYRAFFQGTAAGTWTQSVENDAPTGSGFRKSLKMLCTTAKTPLDTSSVLDIHQNIEGQNLQQFLKGTASAKPFALSFWVKSNVTGTYVASLSDSDNTRTVSAQYTISASATWEKKTIIFPADTTGTFNNDNDGSLRTQFYLVAGTQFSSGTLASTWESTTNANVAVGQTNLAAATNNYWQITGVQLEAGAVATPFEFEDFGITLTKCQRYYEKTYDTTVAPATETADGFAGVGGPDNVASTYLWSTWRFKVDKRALPTVTLYDKLGNSGKVTGWQSGSQTNNLTPNNANWVNGVSSHAVLLQGNYAGWQYNAVASAEL